MDLFFPHEIFDGVRENLLPAKAVLITLLNLSIFHCSLSKNGLKNKSACS